MAMVFGHQTTNNTLPEFHSFLLIDRLNISWKFAIFFVVLAYLARIRILKIVTSVTQNYQYSYSKFLLLLYKIPMLHKILAIASQSTNGIVTQIQGVVRSSLKQYISHYQRTITLLKLFINLSQTPLAIKDERRKQRKQI